MASLIRTGFSLMLIFLALGIIFIIVDEDTHYLHSKQAYLDGQYLVISSNRSGYIKKINVNPFQSVKAGQSLIEFDNKTLEIEYTTLKTRIFAAKEKTQEYQHKLSKQKSLIKSLQDEAQAGAARLKLANFTMKAYQSIKARRDYSEINYQEALSKKQIAVAEIKALKHKIRAAQTELLVIQSQLNYQHTEIKVLQSQLQVVQVELDNGQVKSPYAGRIGFIQVYKNQFYPAGTDLLNMISDQRFWIQASFYEAQMRHIHVGQRALIRFDAIPEYEFTGTVVSQAPATAQKLQVEPIYYKDGEQVNTSQSLPVLVKLELPPELKRKTERFLQPGMSAQVILLIKQGKEH